MAYTTAIAFVAQSVDLAHGRTKPEISVELLIFRCSLAVMSCKWQKDKRYFGLRTCSGSVPAHSHAPLCDGENSSS